MKDLQARVKHLEEEKVLLRSDLSGITEDTEGTEDTTVSDFMFQEFVDEEEGGWGGRGMEAQAEATATEEELNALLEEPDARVAASLPAANAEVAVADGMGDASQADVVNEVDDMEWLEGGNFSGLSSSFTSSTMGSMVDSDTSSTRDEEVYLDGVGRPLLDKEIEDAITGLQDVAVGYDNVTAAELRGTILSPTFRARLFQMVRGRYTLLRMTLRRHAVR